MGEEGDAFEESNGRREGRDTRETGEEKVIWEQCCKVQKGLLFASARIFPSFVEIGEEEGTFSSISGSQTALG